MKFKNFLLVSFQNFFNKNILKKNEEKIKSSILNVENKINIEKNGINDMIIHFEIKNLLWILGNENKNSLVDINDYQEEPSLIYTNLILSKSNNLEKIEKLTYFPSYKDLTPEQRYGYFKFLENPYNKNIDIGYLFILYYGLERYLLSSNYEEAFNVILKLRDIHSNKSFQMYSAKALITICIKNKRGDLAIKFINSLDKEYEEEFSFDLKLLCKYVFGIPLIASEIMKYCNLFGFINKNYIKKYPEIFEEILKENIKNKSDINYIEINSLVSKDEFNRLPIEEIIMFANISLNLKIEIPLIIENKFFKQFIYNLLEATHQKVKEKISLMKKNGETIKEKIIEKKIKIIIDFDTKTEKKLLEELKKNKNIVDRHFSLMNLHEFYYKFRDLDEKYINECIKYCNSDIESIKKMYIEYYEQNKKDLEEIKNTISKEEYVSFLENGIFQGRIVSFERLVIIYEKQKRYDKAMEICDKAIEYYKFCAMPNSQKFEEKKEKFRMKEKKNILK